jgi:YbbR domain-containing protein
MKTVLKAIWNALRSNLVMKIMALLFAVILWSYVLSIINPERTRTVPDIPVRYENMGHLTDNQFQISKSLSDELGNVKVSVVLKQSELKTFSAKNIDAYVDLSYVTGPGDYPLQVQAKLIGVNGHVQDIPVTVNVHVDRYIPKPVPVAVKTIGSVPDGYYASIPEITPTTVEIKGAQTDVEKVASAVCNVNLTGLTEGFSQNMEIDLLDYEGNIVDKNLFPDILPSVIVTLNVQSMKTVPIDAKASIIGQDEVASGYEVSDISCEPQKVAIAGDAQTLAGISSISLVPYSVSGKSASESVALDYQLPEGVTVLTQQKAQVTISIRETTKTKTYKDVSIKTKDLGGGLNADISVPKVDVTVMAGVSSISKLSRSDIVPYVDLDGLKAGTYSLKVLFEIPKGFSEENFTASSGTVTVTIY